MTLDNRFATTAALLALTSLPALPAAQTSASAATPVERAIPSIQQVVGAYAAAWASRDPARIAALHTSDSVFDLRIDVEAPVVGRDAIQARFAGILRDNPTYASTVRKVDFGADFVVIEYDVAMNPPTRFRLGSANYTPTGEPYLVPAIDVIRFRDGLVSHKVTFLDTDTIRAKSRTVSLVGAP